MSKSDSLANDTEFRTRELLLSISRDIGRIWIASKGAGVRMWNGRLLTPARSSQPSSQKPCNRLAVGQQLGSAVKVSPLRRHLCLRGVKYLCFGGLHTEGSIGPNASNILERNEITLD